MSNRNRDTFEKMTPEQRASLVSALVDLKRPEIVEEREAGRRAMDQEFAETGKIATEGDESTAAEFLAFRTLMGELRTFRESKGLSIDDVARMSGLERRMISKLELGYNDNPTLKTLLRYCHSLGVSIAWQATSAAS